jgi:hypothetical protein
MSDEERLDKASERLHSFLRGSAVESRTTLTDDLLLIESYVSLYHAQREMRATAESQNQALQEENERLGKMLVELNDAQVVQEKALLAIRDSKHAVPPVDASECRAIARNALSPTQETDPE